MDAGEITGPGCICRGAVRELLTGVPAQGCANGGTAILVGTDRNRDGVLVGVEIASRNEVCNGANGADGADGADGVGEGVRAAVGGVGAAHGRVEGGEELVLDEHAGAGESVEQRGLAGVGVASDRDARDLAGLTRSALGVADGFHLLDLPTQLGLSLIHI